LFARNLAFTNENRLGQNAPLRNQKRPLAITIAGEWSWSFRRTGRASARDARQVDFVVRAPRFRREIFFRTATYHKTIHVQAGALAETRRWFLDLGDVRVMARLTLNGRTRHPVEPPFRCGRDRRVEGGANALEVSVVNLWPNRLIGDEQLPMIAVCYGAKQSRQPGRVAAMAADETSPPDGSLHNLETLDEDSPLLPRACSDR